MPREKEGCVCPGAVHARRHVCWGACVPWGMHAQGACMPGGACPGGMHMEGAACMPYGFHAQGVYMSRTPPMDRITDTCEILPCPKLCLRAVIRLPNQALLRCL